MITKGTSLFHSNRKKRAHKLTLEENLLDGAFSSSFFFLYVFPILVGGGFVDRETIPDDKAQIGYFNLVNKHNQASVSHRFLL